MEIRGSSPRRSKAWDYNHKHNLKLPPSLSLPFKKPPYPKASCTRQTQRLSFKSFFLQLSLLDSSHPTTMSLHAAYSFKLLLRCPGAIQLKQLQARGQGPTIQWRSLSTSTPSPNDSYLKDALLKEFHVTSLHPPIQKHVPHAGLNSSSIPCAPPNSRPKEKASPKEDSRVHMVDLRFSRSVWTQVLTCVHFVCLGFFVFASEFACSSHIFLKLPV